MVKVSTLEPGRLMGAQGGRLTQSSVSSHHGHHRVALRIKVADD